MKSARLSVAAGIAALAVVAAGCGGSSSDTTTTTAASASEWANGLCSAVATWEDSFKSATEQVTSSPSKESLQTAANDVEAATQTLIDDVKNLGAPDTQSGQDVKTSVDDLTTTLQTQVDAIKTSIDNASGVSGLVSAATDIGASLKTMNSAISSTISTIENADAQGELKDALQSSPDCQSLTK